MSTEKTNTINTTRKNSKSTSKSKRNVFGECANMFVKLYHKACSVLFPANIKCLICGDDLPQKQDIEICEKCRCKLHDIAESECCMRCGAPISGQGSFCLNCQNYNVEFDVARSDFVYDGEIKQLIAGLKYNNKPYLSRTLSHFMAQKYRELNWQADLIIPVPLSDARKKWRGYNQAQLLAEGVSEILNIPINTETLVKVKDTETQASLGLAERRTNLESCFKVLDKYAVRGKKILLIDDVMTTGSTANACTHELKKAHAGRVMVLSIAHGKQDIPTQSSLESIKNLIN